jgi:hypothetical protein
MQQHLPRGLRRLQVGGFKETLKTATAAPVQQQDSRFVAANSQFLQNQQETQMLIIRCAVAELCCMVQGGVTHTCSIVAAGRKTSSWMRLSST